MALGVLVALSALVNCRRSAETPRPGESPGSPVTPAIAPALAEIPLPSPPASGVLFPRDFVLRERMRQDGGELEMRQAFSGNRMHSASSQGKVSIIDFAAQEVVSLDAARKSYRRIPFSDYARRRTQLAQQFAAMPAADRAEIERFMAAFADVRVTDTGEESMIAGLRARHYELTIGPRVDQVWASEALDMPDAYYQMNDLLSPRNGPFVAITARIQAELAKLGYPLRTESTVPRPAGKDQLSVSIVEVVELTFAALPQSEFEIPPGYSQDTGASR